ncbi:MAG: hypothetical protein WAV15_00880 [Minisyncoccia bacterium]
MKIIAKDNILDFSLPLPIYTSVHIADAVCKRGEEFDLLVGLDKKYAEQLRKLSEDDRDIDLQNFTGDRRRFVEKTYEHWYKKIRTPFALIHKQTDSLAAIIWFGPKPIGAKSEKFGKDEHAKEDTWHTISFRSYPLFRGRGMMKNFAKFVLDIYKTHFPQAKLWTGTDERNHVFVKLISELGFQIDEKNSDLPENWLVMTKV